MKIESLSTLPFPMFLYCPNCHAQHVDVGEWETKPHKTHLCLNCQFKFTPHEVYTVGIAGIKELVAFRDALIDHVIVKAFDSLAEQDIHSREDVHTFAGWMTEAMNSKLIERDARKDPRYMDPAYPLEHALACAQDKAEQLVYDAQKRPEDYERVKKTAVHLANFAMIIERKVEAGHRVLPAKGENK